MLDTFFNILKKSLVATIFIIFAFVATYIPQPHISNIETVHAGPVGATEPTQIRNEIELIGVNIATTASAAFDKITSFATNNLWLKEYVLDGIAWAVAKSIVSSMVSSLIDWINSGFEGSPAFVQDLKGFLLNAADEAIGGYLDDLGGIGSFICSPFQLDVQVSVALQYEEARKNKGDGQPAPTCTLSGVIDNIEGFLSGSFSEGGFDDWFTIVATPETYTPYGSMLSAQAGAHARIINAQGEEISLLDFGDGFLSGEICNAVSGANGPEEECFISKPGKIIEEALSFNLDSGRQSLITADEIDEIIAALLSQLANTVLTGAAGLLGLSGGTGYSYSGFSAGAYIDQMDSDSQDIIDDANSRDSLVEARDLQVAIRDLAFGLEPQLDAISIDSAEALRARDTARSVLIDTTGGYPALFPGSGTISQLEALVLEFDDPTTSNQRRIEIRAEVNGLPLYSQQEFDAYQTTWNRLLGNNADRDEVIASIRPDFTDALTAQEAMRDLAQEYEPLFASISSDSTAALSARNDAQVIIRETTGNFPAPSPNEGYIGEVEDLLAEFDDPATTQEDQVFVVDTFDTLAPSLYTASDVNNTRSTWDSIIGNLRSDISAGLSAQEGMRNLAQNYEPILATEVTNGTPNAATAQTNAQIIIAETTGAFPAPSPDSGTISQIEDLLSDFDSAGTNALRVQIFEDFNALSLYSNSDISTTRSAWEAIIP